MTRNIILLAAFALAACRQQDPSGDVADNNAAIADVDVLPPDESMATPSGDLASGATDADNTAGPDNALEAGAQVENVQ